MTAPRGIVHEVGEEPQRINAPPSRSSLGTPAEAHRPIELPDLCDSPIFGATSVGPRGTDHRETSDGYRGEVFRFDRYRVAVSRDGNQWLYQRQRPGNPAVGAAWDTLGYFLTRAALMRLHRSHTGAEAAEIAALPEWIGKSAS